MKKIILLCAVTFNLGCTNENQSNVAGIIACGVGIKIVIEHYSPIDFLDK